MILRRAAVAAPFLFALTALARPADACSPPACRASTTTPGGAVPAGVKAIPFRPSAPTEQTFTILGPGGVEVATTSVKDTWPQSAGKLLVPSVALPAGSYQLAYKESCGVVGGTDVKTPFTVGAAVDLPSTTGTVDAVNRVVGKRSVPTSSGSCTAEIEAVSFDIAVKPSAELLAYRSVAAFEVTIDGNYAAAPYYGFAKEKDGALVITSLHAACGERAAYDNNGPALGIHTVAVKAHVAGATTDPPPVSVEVNFSCTDDTKPPQKDADAGTIPISNPGTSSSSSSSSSSGAVPSNAAAPSEESGCSMSPRSTSVGFAAWAVAALVVGVWRRRKTASR